VFHWLASLQMFDFRISELINRHLYQTTFSVTWELIKSDKFVHHLRREPSRRIGPDKLFLYASPVAILSTNYVKMGMAVQLYKADNNFVSSSTLPLLLRELQINYYCLQ
jgi:hypothetical protein